MKQIGNIIKENSGLIMLIVLIVAAIVMLLSGCNDDSGVTMAFATIIAGTEGGQHVVDGPLTTETVKNSSSDFLLNEIDKRIVKIRPMATPVDQLSRCAGAKRAGSMVVDYYTVDTKLTTAIMTAEYTAPSSSSVTSAAQKALLKTSNDDIFAVSDTILIKSQINKRL